ncbi:MAG: lipid-transfer protein, partial [Deltaproteobacteria bacterium]|nr:lipid-transfer protein [Deltaproteobacteria bacterium]
HRASGLEKSYSDYRAARDIREDNLDMIRHDFYDPFGLIGQPSCFALTLRRYMHEFGITSEQLGWIPVVFSEYAAKNPEAIFYDSLVTIEDYMNSNFIADPIRAMDCAPQVDGAMAIVVASTEKAKSLQPPPAIIMSVAQGTDIEGQLFSSYNQEVITNLPEMQRMGEELFRVAGITPKDIRSAQLDDTFTPLVAIQLEALGFCAPGEGAAFCEGGDHIRINGQLPLNTAGGNFGNGRMDIARIVEAVRQIRGTAINQVKNADTVLVASGAGGPADGLILRK